MPPLLNRPRAAPRRLSLILITAVVVVGSLLSGGIYYYAKTVDNVRIDAEFGRRAEIRNALTREIITNYESSVFALKSLFEGSDEVTRSDFQKAATKILARYPGMAALEWVAIVPGSRRAAIEQQISTEIGRPFQFTEPDGRGGMVRAQSRTEHFAITHVEPMSGNEPAFGYDLQSAPTRPFFERGRKTGELVVSFKFPLVQSRTGITISWPVFKESRDGSSQQTCIGFAHGVFRIDEMLDQTARRIPATATEMLYIDATAETPEQRMLYDSRTGSIAPGDPADSEAEFRHGLHRAYTIEIGTRRWIALYRPTAAWLKEQHTSLPELWLLAGFFITGLLASLAASLSRRTAAIEQLVDQRTRELSESRRHLASLLHALPGMAYRCAFENELRVIFASEGALALTGHEADEFVSGRAHFRDLIHPADLETVRMATRRALQARGDIEVEYRIRTKSGGEKWVLSRGRAIEGGDGKLWFEGLAIDITARKLVEAEKLAIERKLLETQKLESIGLLAGGIAHDFNNLLAGILGNANLARIKLGPESVALDHLRKIEAGTSRAAELCQQMLAYSGKGQRLIEPVDVNQLVRETLPLVQSSFSSHTRVQLDLSAESTVVMADATQLRQIAMNLLINAADAIGICGGEIFIKSGRRWMDASYLSSARVGDSAPPGDYVFLEVRDTGCGMTPDTLTKIFDPFFTTKFAGRGLGLAAVLGIVRGHSGALRVESDLGKGSTFTLILPATNRSIGAATSGSSTPWKQSGKILVIDDEGPVREVAAELIRSFGFEVMTAEDGAEGIQKFKEAPASFTLVVLDLTMPGLDGEETLAQLRAILPNVRVLLVSGYSGSDRVAKLLDDRALYFLQKPFTRGQLERKLQEILG